MSTSKSIAVVGARAIGIPILHALLTGPTHPNVIVLTGPESKKKLPDDLSSAPLISVDYTDVAALTALFKELSIQVVISTVPPPGYKTAQHALADAANASVSVKLFAPSEWGVSTEGAYEEGEENLFAAKDEVAGDDLASLVHANISDMALRISEINWSAVHTILHDRVHIHGKGETPFTVTSQEDIGGFVAHVITSLPPTSPELVNASLRIQGQQLTLREYARIINKPTVTVAEAESLPANTDEEKNFKTFLQAQVEGGMANTGWDRKPEKEIEKAAGSANKLWEGHIWQTMESTT
ncbi:hypothetical protein J3R30DRAFT_3404840 [Lentinula aciculospora]|uniref:NmrA-like domain-containing protein n=1 Tax=Lentinula aciculospora TaxID=153920 RepID=A0A9W9DNI5_9AGAR|nr:hypothetical protein J3R30DRAFT_3404840 [Lentinula aciculospora]